MTVDRPPASAGQEFRNLLSGEDPLTLKGVAEVITALQQDPRLVAVVFDVVFDDDDVVRMRAADALEKLCREEPTRLVPFVDRLLTDMAEPRQPSVQWHLAQMLAEVPLDEGQADRAAAIVSALLTDSDDWIVRNCSLEALAAFTRRGTISRDELLAHLDRVAGDERKSVRSRVRKLRSEFGLEP